MIPETIEKIIRSFDFENYGLHEFTDNKNHEWPQELAHQITEAIAPEIANTVRQGMDYAAKIAVAAYRDELSKDEDDQ